jgi:hypothetical protein
MSSTQNKARGKAALVVPATKKRNPLVAPALQRKAGAHRKTEKALRRADKVLIKGL